MGESWLRSWVQTKCSEVCTHDLSQDSPIQTILAQLIIHLLPVYDKDENLIWLMYLACWHFSCKWRWVKPKPAEICSLSLLFLSSDFLALPLVIEKKIRENREHFCILVCYFFYIKWNRSRCWSRWENPDRSQYQFQPIKFANLVVPSPCETEPYNRVM